MYVCVVFIQFVKFNCRTVQFRTQLKMRKKHTKEHNVPIIKLVAR